MSMRKDVPPEQEVAIMMRDTKRNETRTRPLDKFLSHLEFLRDIYERVSDGELDADRLPSYFEPGGMELIGVACIFLKVLFRSTSGVDSWTYSRP